MFLEFNPKFCFTLLRKAFEKLLKPFFCLPAHKLIWHRLNSPEQPSHQISWCARVEFQQPTPSAVQPAFKHMCRKFHITFRRENIHSKPQQFFSRRCMLQVLLIGKLLLPLRWQRFSFSHFPREHGTMHILNTTFLLFPFTGKSFLCLPSPT